MVGCEVILGHGVDILDQEEFSALLIGPMRGYLDRYFTEAELDAAGEGDNRAQRLAGRFAVKEAVLKSLGIGWGNGVAFTDVEVITLDSGEPAVAPRRAVAKLATDRGIERWLVSVSHTRTVAVASVIAIGSLWYDRNGRCCVVAPHNEQFFGRQG